MRSKQEKENLRDQIFYPLSREEFFDDFLRLTPRQRGYLFILRTAYFFGDAPLTDQDVEGLCPALDSREVTDLNVVLGKFFVRQGDYWQSQVVEDKLANLRSEQQRIKERSLRAKQKAQARWRTTSDKSQNLDATAMPQHSKNDAGAMLQHMQQHKTGPETDATAMPQHSKNDAGAMLQHMQQHKTGSETDATAMPQHSKSDAGAMLQHMQQHKTGSETDATAMPQHSKNDAGAMLQHMQQHKTGPETDATAMPQHSKSDAEAMLQHTEGSYPIDLKRKISFVNSEGFRVHTRASADSDSDNIFINKNINNKNKSESVSESDRESKNLNSWNTRETDSISEAVRWLSEHGLNPATAVSFERKNSERMQALPSIVSSLGTEAEDVLDRCRQSKADKGDSFEHAVNFVVTSLERCFQQRQGKSKQSASAQPKRFRDIDYMEGIERLNPDGTFVLKSKSERGL